MAERKKINSNFVLIDTHVVDASAQANINTILNNLKAKGRSLDITMSKDLKNIVDKAIAEIDETTHVEIYWADMYEDAKIVKIKVIINQEFCLEDGELKKLADELLKTLKVKMINYGLSNQNPALIIWM